MNTRNDYEKDKFFIDNPINWETILRINNSEYQADIITENIDTLENLKFNNNWEVRIVEVF